MVAPALAIGYTPVVGNDAGARSSNFNLGAGYLTLPTNTISSNETIVQVEFYLPAQSTGFPGSIVEFACYECTGANCVRRAVASVNSTIVNAVGLQAVNTSLSGCQVGDNLGWYTITNQSTLSADGTGVFIDIMYYLGYPGVSNFTATLSPNKQDISFLGYIVESEPVVGDFFHYDDFESGYGFSTYLGNQMSVSGLYSYAGNSSLALAYDSNSVSCNNQISNTAFNLTEYSTPYCLESQVLYTDNSNVNLEQGFIWDTWAAAFLVDSDPTGSQGGVNITFVDDSVWTPLAPAPGVDTWAKLKVCFDDGWAASGSTNARFYVDDAYVGISNVWPRDKLDNVCLHNREPASTTYFDDLKIWNYSEYGVIAPLLPCVSAWSCTGYDQCNEQNETLCNSVFDNNACDYNYTGDYSEFAQACTYEEPAPASSGSSSGGGSSGGAGYYVDADGNYAGRYEFVPAGQEAQAEEGTFLSLGGQGSIFDVKSWGTDLWNKIKGWFVQ
jgi:hypothetical protein